MFEQQPFIRDGDKEVEEKIYKDLINYFDESSASQISSDLDLTYRAARWIKHEVKLTKGEAGKDIAPIPAKMAKQIEFYITKFYRNSSE
ncbi:hypothetical protein [Psychrobacillus sp.]|uniref:hypothetical protein n=1 Tax=Psychrobacillus sp. TaxID=1871623 RepID=UPI0028BF2E1C|nr:hypothetical protein [Psychrobacillus sp.]